MTETANGDVSPMRVLGQTLWKGKWIILACLVIGALFGLALSTQPPPPSQFSQILSLKITSRFLPRDEVFDRFRIEWQRTPLWSGDSKLSASVQYENSKYVATIRLLTEDASGQAIAQYRRDLQELIDRFANSVIEDANLQLHELQDFQQMPGAAANDYLVSTIHQQRLAIADAKGDPGLMVLDVATPVTQAPGGSRVPTLIVAAILGGLMGVLLSIARMIWSIAGQYARDAQTEAASSPEPARTRR